MITRLLAYFRRVAVSEAWIRAQVRAECASGVDLPRWKFPKEVIEEQKAARLQRIAAMRRQGWRKQA